MNDITTAIITKYRELYQAMVTSNILLLKQILADDFVLTHMTGIKQTKPEWIAAIEDHSMTYYSHQEESVRIDDQGTLTCRNVVSAKIYGMRGDFSLQMRIRFKQVDGEWLIKSAVTSSY